jgi:hypothetical protein
MLVTRGRFRSTYPCRSHNGNIQENVFSIVVLFLPRDPIEPTLQKCPLLLVLASIGREVDGIYSTIAWCVWWRDSDRASPKRQRNIRRKKGNDGQWLGLHMDIQGYLTPPYIGFGSQTCPLHKARADNKGGLGRKLPPKVAQSILIISLI